MTELDEYEQEEAPVTETVTPTPVVPVNTIYSNIPIVKENIPIVNDSPPFPDNIPIVKDSPPFPDNIPVRYDG